MFVKICQNKPTLRQTKFYDVKMEVMSKFLTKYFLQYFFKQKRKNNEYFRIKINAILLRRE